LEFPKLTKLASRMSEIQPFEVMEILNRAEELEAQGRHVIRMQISEPGFTAPGAVIAAATEALKEHPSHHTFAVGIPRSRYAVWEH
jgi:aspartate/methionine/tyrosine aminotransferase